MRIVVYGLGPIGSLIARKAFERGYEIVGGVEVDPDKVGRSVGEVVGVKGLDAPVIHDRDALDFLKRVKPDVAVISTGSYLGSVYPQIAKCIEAGVDVVSTSETLAYPWYRYPELATLIDRAAKMADVRVIGTGVNPGFIFDTLPAVMSTVCTRVERIVVKRMMDASKRRLAFQKKIGVGLPPSEFEKLMEEGILTGHVGYAESVYLLASMLGVELERVEEWQEPMVAKNPVESGGVKVEAGRVYGIRGGALGYSEGREFIRFEFIAAVGYEDRDEVLIEGEPTLKWVCETGISGDIATAGAVLNVLARIKHAPPGLITMKHLHMLGFSHS